MTDNWKIRRNQMTFRQQKFCEEYLTNGRVLKDAAVSAGYAPGSAALTGHKLLKTQAVHNYLTERVKKSNDDLQIGFDYKLAKLKKIVDLAIPDEADTILQISPRSGIAAIAELNKMQGHYSAEKVVAATLSVNADADLSQAKELVQQLIIDKTTGY